MERCSVASCEFVYRHATPRARAHNICISITKNVIMRMVKMFGKVDLMYIYAMLASHIFNNIGRNYRI